MTLQPERSGHYIYTFVQLSDANYKRIELKGPSIDQVVHPLAAADFAETERSKRRISSCEGSMVDVGVDLRVGDQLRPFREVLEIDVLCRGLDLGLWMFKSLAQKARKLFRSRTSPPLGRNYRYRSRRL